MYCLSKHKARFDSAALSQILAEIYFAVMFNSVQAHDRWADFFSHL